MAEISNTNQTIKETYSSKKSKYRKHKKSQIPLGFVILVAIVIIGILLSKVSTNLGLFWMIGICFGVILQKSRFCFTASMRDPSLTGSTSLTKAVLVALAITTIGFTAIRFGLFSNGLLNSQQISVPPISITTVIGAFMFGIGMVISGGCASGTLMRVGEGFLMQILTLVFFITGSLWGAHNFGWWNTNFITKGKPVFLPNIFGWFGSVVLQLLLIAALYILADKWGSKKQNF